MPLHELRRLKKWRDVYEAMFAFLCMGTALSMIVVFYVFACTY